ncbi:MULTISPECIES: hypothetical protein [unclassified Nonomuraea]|uniref:hypothetical protein n=1 Tax=unclassified Nonomuraea TaxID=2593643 RepID=UPI00269673DE
MSEDTTAGGCARSFRSPRADPEGLAPAEVDRPEPMATEVLARVHAAGVNPTDWKSRTAGRLLGDPFAILG